MKYTLKNMEGKVVRVHTLDGSAPITVSAAGNMMFTPCSTNVKST